MRQRHHAVASLIDNHEFETMSECLAEIGDIERILARVALLSARPRDLSTLASTLQMLPTLQQQLAQHDSPLLQELAQAISTHPEVVALLDAAIIDLLNVAQALRPFTIPCNDARPIIVLGCKLQAAPIIFQTGEK